MTHGDGTHGDGHGIDPGDLDEETLLDELEHLHDTRHTTFRHGSDDALSAHERRTRELETEYLRRHPGREVDPARTRAGARSDT
jgi:hypothetical protein